MTFRKSSKEFLANNRKTIRVAIAITIVLLAVAGIVALWMIAPPLALVDMVWLTVGIINFGLCGALGIDKLLNKFLPIKILPIKNEMEDFLSVLQRLDEGSHYMDAIEQNPWNSLFFQFNRFFCCASCCKIGPPKERQRLIDQIEAFLDLKYEETKIRMANMREELARARALLDKSNSKTTHSTAEGSASTEEVILPAFPECDVNRATDRQLARYLDELYGYYSEIEAIHHVSLEQLHESYDKLTQIQTAVRAKTGPRI